MEKEPEKVPVNEYPLTEEETAEIANRAGFSDIRTVWKRGSFAVFRLRA